MPNDPIIESALVTLSHEQDRARSHDWPDFACGIGESKKPSILAAPMLSFPKLMGLRKFE